MSSEAFFPWNDKDFQAHFPHGITMSVLALKSFSDTVLLEIIVQLAKLKFRYHFRNYKRLAIFGPVSLSSTFIRPLFRLTSIYPLVPSRAFSLWWHGRSLKMPSSPTSSPTMATIFELSMGRLDLFGTRLRKFYETTFTLDLWWRPTASIVITCYPPLLCPVSNWHSVTQSFPHWSQAEAFTYHMTRGFITYEEDLDHSDAGVGLCPLLHNAFCRSNFVTVNLSKHHRTFLPSPVQTIPVSSKPLHDYVMFMIKFDISVSCKILVLLLVPTATRRNAPFRAKLSPMLNAVKFLGPTLTKPLHFWLLPGPEAKRSHTA
jgi:hypothetical protein